MTSKPALLFGVVLAACGVVGPRVEAAAPPMAKRAGRPTVAQAWVERVKTEGKAAYDKYAALALRLDETAEVKAKKIGTWSGKMQMFTGVRRERYVRLGDHVILEKATLPDEKEDTPRYSVECDNPDYNFALGKTGGDRPYALRDYRLGARKLPLAAQSNIAAHDQAYSEIKHVLAAIDGTGDHALAGLRFDAGMRLLVADLRVKAKNSDIKITLIIDTTAGWRFAERRVDTKHAFGSSKFTYGKVIDGVARVALPELIEEEVRYKSPDTSPDMSFTTRVLEVKVTDKTPADFRLSGFGLPEPADAPPPPPPPRWHLWLLGCAAITAVLAFGFAWLRRRYMAPPEGTT